MECNEELCSTPSLTTGEFTEQTVVGGLIEGGETDLFILEENSLNEAVCCAASGDTNGHLIRAASSPSSAHRTLPPSRKVTCAMICPDCIDQEQQQQKQQKLQHDTSRLY